MHVKLLFSFTKLSTKDVLAPHQKKFIPLIFLSIIALESPIRIIGAITTKATSRHRDLSKPFKKCPLLSTIHTTVELPKEEHDSKKIKLVVEPITRAIEAEGLSQKAEDRGTVYLSRLDPRERISVLKHLGEEVYGDHPYMSIAKSTSASTHVLHRSSFEDLDSVSSPFENSGFSVINTRDLYAREAYKDLYDEIALTFALNQRKSGQKQIVVAVRTVGYQS
ncbi:hypothetical protein BGX26_011760 [Mortierella sp. AD094]|nr:hypothetical protein BGX26_011760 [Mortierella sp. AD094]